MAGRYVIEDDETTQGAPARFTIEPDAPVQAVQPQPVARTLPPPQMLPSHAPAGPLSTAHARMFPVPAPTSTLQLSDPNAVSARRQLQPIADIIEHPVGAAISGAMGVGKGVTLGMLNTDEATKAMPGLGLTPSPLAEGAGEFAGIIAPWEGIAGAVSSAFNLADAGRAGKVITQAATGGIVGATEASNTGGDAADEAATTGAFAGAITGGMELPSAIRESNWWRMLTNKERGLVVQTMDGVRSGLKAQGWDEGQVQAKMARLDPETFQAELKKRMTAEGVQAAPEVTLDGKVQPIKEAAPAPPDQKAPAEAEKPTATEPEVPGQKITEAQAKLDAIKANRGRYTIEEEPSSDQKPGAGSPAAQESESAGTELRPAVKLPDGTIKAGELTDRHDDLLKQESVEPGTGNVERGFVDDQGAFLTRGEAMAHVEENAPAVHDELVKAGVSELHSEDLQNAVQEVQNVEAQKAKVSKKRGKKATGGEKTGRETSPVESDIQRPEGTLRPDEQRPDRVGDDTKSDVSRGFPADNGSNAPDLPASSPESTANLVQDGGVASQGVKPGLDYSKVHPKAQAKFEAALADKDTAALNDWLHLDNLALRAEFERRTGVKLPKTVKGTRAVVEEWGKAESKEPEMTYKEWYSRWAKLNEKAQHAETMLRDLAYDTKKYGDGLPAERGRRQQALTEAKAAANAVRPGLYKGEKSVEELPPVQETTSQNEPVSPAPFDRLQKIMDDRNALTEEYNKKLDAYKAADEAAKPAIKAELDKIHIAIRKAEGQIQEGQAAMFKQSMREKARDKYGAMDTGTKVGMIGYDADSSYWTKIEANKWQRTLGGKTSDIFKTDEEMEGHAVTAPASEPVTVQTGDNWEPGGKKVPEKPTFQTGKPVTFGYIHNKEKAPNMGERFGQHLEPAGRYLNERPDTFRGGDYPNMEDGEVTFKNPLVLDWGGGYGDPDNWKQVLSGQYGGKKGKALSKAITKAGYDGIITMDAKGNTSEIVDLTGGKPASDLSAARAEYEAAQGTEQATAIFDTAKESALTAEIKTLEKKLQNLRDKHSKDGRSAMIPPAIRAEQMKNIEKLADQLGKKQEELEAMYEAARAEEEQAAAIKEREERLSKETTRVDEHNRLRRLGEEVVPGLRFSDQAEAGRIYEFYKSGEMTDSQWQDYVDELGSSGKITGGAKSEPVTIDPSKDTEMVMSGDKDVRLQQRPRLQSLYPDYSAPHHDVFVQKYNKELDAARTKMYEENRGINAQGNVASPATPGLTAEDNGLPTSGGTSAETEEPTPAEITRVSKMESDIAETEALLNDPKYDGERENLQLHLDEQKKQLEELTRGPKDFTIAAQRPGMTKDDLKTVADVVQAFKDGKITYGSNALKYEDSPNITMKEMDDRLDTLPKDAKVTVGKDKVTITVKGEPLTDEQKAENRAKAQELTDNAVTMKDQAATLEKLDDAAVMEKYPSQKGFDPGTTKHKDEADGRRQYEVNRLLKAVDDNKIQASDLLTAKSKDIKHVFYFEGDRIQQAKEAGGDPLFGAFGKTPDPVKHARTAMKQLAGMDKNFASNPHFTAVDTPDNGLMLVYKNGRHEMRLLPDAFNMTVPVRGTAAAYTPFSQMINPGDTVRLSPGYLENKTDEVYLIPRGGEGETFYDITTAVPLALKQLASMAKAGRAALPHLETIARQSFKEGAETWRDFIKSMRQKLGELWERFKGMMETVWNRVKRTINNEVGAVGRDLKIKYNAALDKADEAIKNQDAAGLDKWLAELDGIEQDIRRVEDEELAGVPADSGPDRGDNSGGGDQDTRQSDAENTEPDDTPRTTSIKKAVVAEERQAQGKEPVTVQMLRRSFPNVFDRAKAMIDSGELDPKALAENLSKNPRGLTAEEVFALDYGRMQIQNEHRKVMDLITAAQEDKQPVDDLRTRLAKIEDDQITNDVAARYTAYEQGLGFAARRYMIQEDYSLAALVMKARAASPDAKISDELRRDLEALSKQYEEATKAIADRDAKISELEAQRKVQKIVNEEPVRRRPKSVTRNESRAQIDADIRSRTSRLLGKYSARLNFMFDPEDIAELAALARDYVEKGVTKAEEIIDNIYDELRDLPDLERRDIRDAISGYGKSYEMSKDEIEKALREARRQMRLVSALEDAQQGEVPLHSGLQRDPVSDEVRDLQRQIHDAMREMGIDQQSTRSPEQQWKTAIDSIKTRLKNEIHDLDEQVNARAVTHKKRAHVKYDDDAEKLKAERDSKKKILQEIDELNKEMAKERTPDEDLTQKSLDDFMARTERLIKAKEKALDNAIEEFKGRVKDGKLSPDHAQPETPDTPEILVKKAELESLKATIEQMRKDARPAKDPAAVRLQTIKTRLAHEIEALEKQIKAGKKAESTRSPVDYDAEAKRLKAIRDEKKAQLEEIDATPPKTMAELEKLYIKGYKTRTANKIAEYERRLKEEDFSKREARFSPQAIKEMRARDAEGRELTNKAEQLKDKMDQKIFELRQANRTRLEKTLDTGNKVRRAVLLSSPFTIGKLTAAAAERSVFSPVESAYASVSTRLPVIGRIIRQSPVYGTGLNVRAEAVALKQWLSKGTWRDSLDVIRTGSGELDRLYGGKHRRGGEDTAWLEFFGRIHGAIKNPVKRAAFFRTQQAITEWYIQNGYDVYDPAIRIEIDGMSYIEAQRAILMQDNSLVKATRQFTAALRREGGNLEKIGAAVIDFLIPIMKIPTNFATEVIQSSPLGIADAIYQSAKQARGKEPFTKEQANNISRAWLKGGIGCAMILLGYYFDENVGGYYQPGEKRAAKDVKWGNIKVMGLEINNLFLHHPLLEVLQIGATIHRVQRYYQKQNEKNIAAGHPEKVKEIGPLTGVYEGALGVAKEIPLFEQQVRIGEATRSADTFKAWAFQTGKSLLTPFGMERVSKMFDKAGNEQIPREQKQFWAEVMRGVVPGQRDKLPLDMKKVQKMQLDQLAEIMEHAPSKVTEQIRPVFRNKFRRASGLTDDERERYRDILSGE